MTADAHDEPSLVATEDPPSTATSPRSPASADSRSPATSPPDSVRSSSYLSPPLNPSVTVDGPHPKPSRPLRRAATPAAESSSAPPPAVHATQWLRLTHGQRTRQFRKKFFPGVPSSQWNDWRWQARHRFRSLAQIEQVLALSEDERQAMIMGGTMLPVGITPYYMSLLDPADPAQPLRRTVIATTAEFTRTQGEADDPLGEDTHTPVPGLVHRYPDRVLLLALDFCSTYCRYCTRSRVVGHGEIMPNEQRLQRIFDYLRQATEVRDVLISGGDPLALGEDRLDWILTQLRSIPHIQFVRIGTKMPAVLPQRITRALCRMLRKHHPLWMSLHFLHPDECTPEAAKACGMLADAGIPLGSQTVLLKGVNDDVGTMQALMHRMLMMRVRPYYLYQCDPISGSAHFRTPVSKGLEIIEGLRGHTTGYAVPTYVIDAPQGGGKIPLQPGYIVDRTDDHWTLRNYEGNHYRYPDPQLPADLLAARRALPVVAPASGAASALAASLVAQPVGPAVGGGGTCCGNQGSH